MPSTTQNKGSRFGLGVLPDGVYFTSFKQAAAHVPLRGQLHHMRRAFAEPLKVDGILCVDDRPTAYFKDFAEPLTRREINRQQQLCWNQGVATVLVLRDPHNVFIFSGLVRPSNENEKDISEHDAFVKILKWSAGVLESNHLVENLVSGHFYRENSHKFFQDARTVDQFLVRMLGDLAEHLNEGGDKKSLRHIHSFLGRLIFTCYLIDRGIIKLEEYSFIQRQGIKTILDILEKYPDDKAIQLLFDDLFRVLKKEFNGSTFEGSFSEERKLISSKQIDLLRQFFRGQDIGSPQMSLGFWAFDFSVIPVETISAIYEKFLEREDIEDKDAKGAFYTPRHLAEMVVAEALHGCDSLLGKKFLDPSCGSGVFLVIIFNRLAEEWRLQFPRATVGERIAALIDLLEHLRGIDVNETACRIACFSLYIALLDQFDPPVLHELKEEAGSGKRAPLLPPLLAFKRDKWRTISSPTIFEGNYFDPNLPIGVDYDFIIGNPPWVSRQTIGTEVTKWMASDACPVKGDDAALSQEQIALAFLWKVPTDLAANGAGCLILPSQILLNKTDAFQREWFSRFSVPRLLHLADYRRFLFENAIRPCFILHFGKTEPTVTASIEYVVPKVMRLDPRTGLIPVNAEDRRFFRVSELIEAAKEERASLVWKTRLWGTHRDLKLIEALMDYPTLGDHAGEPNEDKRWVKRQGFKPWYRAAFEASPDSYGDPKPIGGSLNDPFIDTDELPELILAASDCSSLRQRLLEVRCRGYVDSPEEHRHASLEGFHRSPDGAFIPPLVLVNHGFTRFAFADFKVFYQHSLTGIHGPKQDADLLLFLVVYLRSKLAKYFQFHTASNLGTERPKVETHELMRLPLPLPGDDCPITHGSQIVKKVADEARKTRLQLEKLQLQFQSSTLRLDTHDQSEKRSALLNDLQNRLEPLVYQYFGLNQDDLAVIEDACDVYWPSATPESPTKDIETLRPTKPLHLQEFCFQLCSILNRWTTLGLPKRTKPKHYFTSEYASLPSGLCIVTLKRAPSKQPPQAAEPKKAAEALSRLASASGTTRGAFAYLRSIVHSTPDAIYILRPDLRGQWTRTAAMNTADAIYGAIKTSKPS